MKFNFKGSVFSQKIKNSSSTHKVAYIGVMTALCAVCNMFFEFKFADTQFSLTIFFSALTGVIIGPVYGFVACFLGDLVGFLYHSAGYTYYPWIGISMGLIATVSGVITNGVSLGFKGEVFLKLGIVAVLTFALCTTAINTTAFWIVYNNMQVPYFAYFASRMIAKGQIWNSLLNYALLFGSTPVIKRFSDGK